MSFNILMCAILCSAGVSRPHPPIKAIIRDRSTSLRAIPFRQVIHDRSSQRKSISEFVSEPRTPIPLYRYILVYWLDTQHFAPHRSKSDRLFALKLSSGVKRSRMSSLR
ncbi:hypothetical protein AVEN_81074-1 [Araneus ventricosus]|uniref:Secreted protein n=1 Tax=Araneus ventricosus TaxID=182803 RepID=A0A4Y2M4J3_ARAVE|nr:hypothetical protein AVEN_81074-1 [Araneus ventricosus]